MTSKKTEIGSLKERRNSLFSAFDREDKETVRPEYDYDEYQEKI